MEENNNSQNPQNPYPEQNNSNPQLNGQVNKESTYWENNSGQYYQQPQVNPADAQWSGVDVQPQQTQQAQQPAQNQQASQTPEQFYQYYQQQMNNGAGNQQYYTQPQYSQPAYQQGATPKPPKKKHRGAMVAVIVVLLLLFSAAGTAYAFRGTLSNTLAKMTKSPSEYYSSIEKGEMQEVVDNIASTSISGKKQAYKVTTDVSFNSETIDSMLQSTLGVSLSDLESSYGIQLKNVGFDATIATDGKVVNEILGLRLNQINLISAKLFADTAAQKIFMQVPELSEAYLSLAASDDFSGADLSPLEKINSEVIADMLDKYSNIIIDDITDVEKEDNVELSVDTLSTKCTKLTATIGLEDYIKMSTDVLEAAKEDQTIIDLLPVLNMTEEDYQYYIDEAISSVEDSAENTDDSSLIMEVYVNSKGEVIGRKISTDAYDGAIGYTVLTKGSLEEYKVYVTDDSGNDVLVINGNHTKDKNGACTGKASAELNLSDSSTGLSDVTVDISYEDLRTEKKGSRTYQYGTVTISSMDLLGMELTMDYSVNGNIQECSVALNMGAASIVSADISVEYLDNYDVTMPSDDAEIYDINDTEGYYSTIDLQGFISQLSDQLGVDIQGIIDSLTYGYY